MSGLVTVLAALVLLMSATNADITTINDCSDLYDSAKASAISLDDTCSALNALERCILHVLAVAPTATLAQEAAPLLSNAIAASRDCSLDEMAIIRPYVAISNGTLEFHVSSDKDVIFFQHSVTSTTIAEISDRVAAAENVPSSVTDTLSAIVDAFDVDAQAAIDDSNAYVNTAFTQGLAESNELLTAMSTTISTTQSALTATLNDAWTTNDNANTAILAEAAAVDAWQTNIQTQIATTRQNLIAAINLNSVELATLTAEDQNFALSLTQQVNNLVATYQAGEATRGVAEAADLSTQVSSAYALSTGDLSTTLSREVSRATVAATTLLNSTPPKISPVVTGSTDETACSTEGSSYYSSGRNLLYVCSNLYWVSVPIINNAFSTSTILNQAQSVALATAIGYNRWTLCYSAVSNGWSSSTFHSLCNNRGPTVTIAISSSNYIGGGYSDRSWTSNSNYLPSGAAFLFKFTSDVISRTTLVYPQNAMYDYSSYGATFGGGHDWYTSSNLQTSYTSQHSYNGPNYNSNWLFTTSSSVTVVKYETYYMV